MHRIILFLVLVLSIQNATAYVIETSHTVHFDKDDHDMTETQKESLLLFLSSCDLSYEHSFRLEGHTDSDGSVDYNLALSDRRAETI